MIIYPTIELQKGRCVSLRRGKLDDAVLWHVDPLEKALSFAEAGAEWMHLTDFDAIDGGDDSAALVEEIIRKVGIPVQLGGGMRSRDHIESWIDRGAGRIVVGTLAAREPHLVRELAEHHPDQIVVAVDVWRGQVMTEGWREAGAFAPEAYIEAFGDAPFAALIVTDIDSDIDEVDGSLGVIAGLASVARAPVIASGVVRTLDDVARLAYIPNISGAIVGRALFQRSIDLNEALAAARVQAEPVAEFL